MRRHLTVLIALLALPATGEECVNQPLSPPVSRFQIVRCTASDSAESTIETKTGKLHIAGKQTVVTYSITKGGRVVHPYFIKTYAAAVMAAGFSAVIDLMPVPSDRGSTTLKLRRRDQVVWVTIENDVASTTEYRVTIAEPSITR